MVPRRPGGPSSWGSQPNRFNVLTPNRVDYGMDPAIVNNATYGPELKADLKTLPIISITIKLDDLFNPSADPYVGGIYANSIQEDVSGRNRVRLNILIRQRGHRLSSQLRCPHPGRSQQFGR